MGGDHELTDLEQRILDNVEEFGCHITSVSPADDEDDFLDDDDEEEGGEPERFAYSIGFPRTVGQPEVIVFGFSATLAAAVINGVLDRCRDGLVLEDWAEVDGLLQGHKCMLREVEPDCLVPYYFNSAIWFARHETGEDLSRAFQIVWPGVEDGLFPWDKGCAEATRDLQTPLYRTSLNS